ncbi:MAG: hypothetical protein GX442_11820 [Candidatus Riflebacteria bacterium]|nr:hypothetical protein [Candidatus Riflebacteria bacterium]
MISTSLRSLNIYCIIGYLAFMGLAIDSSMVDALVFYVTDQNGQAVFSTGLVQSNPLPGGPTGSSPLVALQFRSQPAATPGPESAPPTPPMPAAGAAAPPPQAAPEDERTEEIALIEHQGTTDSFSAPAPDPQARDEADAEDTEGEGEGTLPLAPATQATNPGRPADDPQRHPAALAPRLSPPAQPGNVAPTAAPAPVTLPLTPATSPRLSAATVSAVESGENPSILTLLKTLPERPWTYNPMLDRYVVRYDAETTIVLTLRPSLQTQVEKLFAANSCKLGAAIIQDPTTGAVLAMTSFDGWRPLSPTSPEFRTNNWALQPTFPIASIFKIITAAAGLEKRKVTPASSIKLGRKWSMTLWEAFAKSHNGVFGIVGRSVGSQVLQAYANAFGFNKPFYFDLPVGVSQAELPANAVKLGEAAAGLNRNFEISPIHVASIISTVLNRGRQMKPYLVDYVLRGNRVIFRRKPFPIAQPMSAGAAQQIYEMMKTTTTHGTGKRGFSKFPDCPDLARLCGGKTGTLTGANPHLLFTWFGGFTRTAGRDLSIVFLVGQPGMSRMRASTLAGRLAHELYAGRATAATPRLATR